MSREGLISRNDLTVAASAINAIAEPIQLNPLRPTGLASIESIAHRVLELQEATSILSSDEVISMKRGDTNESVIIPRNIVITENSFKSIFVVRSEIERTTTDLVVKKMDLLGTSKWDFIYKGKKISASIDDLVFITLFHQRATEAIKPHDSVYADLEILNDIGYDSNVVSSKYHVKKIHKILPNPDSGQQTLT
jgi:hypothetical protein